MRTFFTKTQIKIVAVLGAVAALMLGGTLFYKLNGDVPAQTTPYVHEKIRDPRPSLSPYFDREINIGGSGDENLTDVFSANGKIYIFGDTTSQNYDFDEGGGVFLALISEQGATLGFKTYSSGGGKLIRAALCEDGFLLGINDGGEAKVIKIDFDGTKTGEVSLGGGETIADIKRFDSAVAVLTYVADSGTNVTNMKARLYDFNLAIKAERLLSHACSLSYLDMFEHDGGYAVAVNLVSPILKRLAFITFALSASPLVYDVDLGEEGGYRADAVIPFSNGFAAAIVNDKGICDIITVTKDLSLHSRVFLKQSSVASARLMYAPDGYYCLMRRGGSLCTMIVLDEVLSYAGVAAQFAAVGDVVSHSIFRDSAMFCCESEKGVRLITRRDGKTVGDISFGGAGMTNVKAVKCGERIFAVCETSRTSDDCPTVFGGKDIWIARII